jgi:iron-sulfur cluster assembly protein
MSINVSDKAAERIAEIRSEQKLDKDVPLRIGVVGGGCSGLTYKLDFDNDVSNRDEKDQIFENKGIKIIVDMRSFLYLAGTELDYTDGLNGQGFHFNNPNATRTCSCGESFSV